MLNTTITANGQTVFTIDKGSVTLNPSGVDDVANYSFDANPDEFVKLVGSNAQDTLFIRSLTGLSNNALAGSTL